METGNNVRLVKVTIVEGSKNGDVEDDASICCTYTSQSVLFTELQIL